MGSKPFSIIIPVRFLEKKRFLTAYCKQVHYSDVLCFKHGNVYCETLCKIKSHHQYYPNFSGIKITVGAFGNVW